MKNPFLLALFLALFLAACSGSPTTAPAVPTFSPPETLTPLSATPAVGEVATAVPAAATVAMTDEQATATSTPAATKEPATPTLPPATGTRVPPAAASAGSLAVQQRVSLLTLPGVGRDPSALAQIGNTLYVADWGSDNLAVIRDRHVQSYISTGQSPNVLLADPANARLYVANYMTPTLSLIQNDKVATNQPLDSSVTSLVLTQNRLLVGLSSSPTIEIRDPVTLQKKGSVKLSQGFDVMRLVVDEPRHRLYAGVYEQIVVLNLDNLQELRSFRVAGFSVSLAVNPVDGTLWVGGYDAQRQSGTLTAFNEQGQQLRQLLVDEDLRGSGIDSSGRLFVVSAYMNRVDVIDIASGTLVTTIGVSDLPEALLLDNANHVAYVANHRSDSISVLDTQSLRSVATIPVGIRLSALASNEARGRVYAANSSSDSVFVVENGKVIREIPVGHDPQDLARDEQTGRLFAANYSDGTLSVVDENSLTVQATLPITRYLSTVAVDPVNRRLFAGSAVLGLDNLTQTGAYFARGYTVGSLNPVQFARVDPPRKNIYAVAYNGVPGSNQRAILYAFSYDRLESQPLGYPNGGNITALLVDSDGGRIYATATHPLGYNSALDVWDANGKNLGELGLSSRTMGLALNPHTNHLFLAHASTYVPYSGAFTPRDNTVQIIDTRTLGDVAWLSVPGSPGEMTRLGDTIYVAGLDDGVLTLISDVATAQPPAPTATSTPTPYPTWTATPQIPAALPTGTPTQSSGSSVCASNPPEPFLTKYNQFQDRLGCPSSGSQRGSFAYQPFQTGFMFDDLRNNKAQMVYVFFADHTYKSYPDTWASGQSEDSCPNTPVSSGLTKPIRGFGKVWCQNADVRARLSGATLNEQGVTLQLSSFERGMIWAETPAGVLALFADGTWQ